jgi:hypothetical protein
MEVGVLIPQGWKYEYNVWNPARSRARSASTSLAGAPRSA